MDIGDIIAACISFQNAIRADRVDPRSWECLGDAYKERGSYVSAIKAYARCVELTSEEDPKIIYPLYQIASIKHLLSLFDEAITDYKRILEFRADYVPVLQGTCYLINVRPIIRVRLGLHTLYINIKYNFTLLRIFLFRNS